MHIMTCDRRHFLLAAASTSAGLLLASGSSQAREVSDSHKLHLATNVYPWITFYRREQRDFNASLDEGLAAVARSGVDGFEPILNRPEDVDRLAPLLQQHQLEMRSFYVNSELHDAGQADRSIAAIVQIARRARDIGARIVVTNPNPIKWGGTANKSDAQLRVQAQSLDRLGEQLRELSLVLAYHNHDMEMRCSAREFHHMMQGTHPELVTLCLDAHWIYRGAENSQVALFDIVKMYAPRVTELHIRQSVDQIWTESFRDGDIDYGRLVSLLSEQGIHPHHVLEQAVEAKSPQTMDATEAHALSVKNARRVFAPLAS
jgi:inosose dehydratase